MVAIKFNNVTKEYKTSGQSVKALDNVSFSIEKGASGSFVIKTYCSANIKL